MLDVYQICRGPKKLPSFQKEISQYAHNIQKLKYKLTRYMYPILKLLKTHVFYFILLKIANTRVCISLGSRIRAQLI